MSVKTIQATKASNVSNYRSKGGSIIQLGELAVKAIKDKLSKVLHNSNQTPYVWYNDGHENGSSMCYMSKKGRALAEELEDKLSLSKHAIQLWANGEDDTADGYEETYVITLVNEEFEAGVPDFAK